MKKGFFDEEDFVTSSTEHLCQNCSLSSKSKHPYIKPIGNGDEKILIISSSPNKEEDAVGKLLVGLDGTFFKKQLQLKKINLFSDCWVTSVTQCHSLSPSKNEMLNCLPNILKFIKDKKPKFVLLLGEQAVSQWFASRFSTLTLPRWRGLCIPDFERNVWVIPIEHPLEAIKEEKNNLFLSQYNRDLQFAIECFKTKPDLNELKKPDIDSIVVLKEYKQILEELDKLITNPPKILAFDYETTGLKPYRKNHKIVSVSYCCDLDKAFAFPMQHTVFNPLQQKAITRKWGEVLKNKSKKVAHNIKFEDVWSRTIGQSFPNNWHWCTMLAAHSLDNRSKYSGLKFQSFLYWGVPNYDRDIKSFLQSFDDTGFNKVLKAPLDKLLLYNGRDSLLTYWLYHKQKPLFDEHLEKGINLFIEGSLALADVQINGINMDTEYYDNTHIELSKQIKELGDKLLELPECKQFEKQFGHVPNLGSSQDLSTIFYDILKLTPTKTTTSGKNSVDAEAVSKLDSALAKSITKLSVLKKVDSTYIVQFMKEIDEDGRLHPFYDLGTVKTYRGSSNSPNFQNIPVRNKEAKKYSRSGIIPTKGFKILDFDYSAIEVRMGACYTKDPVLLKYIKDEKTDMHRDTAMDIFKLPANKVTKDLRFYTKNGFVFPEWYGSYYKNCAKNIWSACAYLKTGDDITVFEHLQDVGVIRRKQFALDEFSDHVKKVETAYWKKFKVFKQWQDEQYTLYEKTGIIELLSGFRCRGYSGRNEIVNYRFQGSAFHCLLWSLTQINAELHERKMNTKIIGQIHDCCLLDVDPNEEKEIKILCTEIATKRIREYFEWIIVPLAIEWEETEIDKSWYSKKEIREE